MIWIKTDAGREEIQTRSKLKDRQLRTLLLLIDGIKSEDMLLAHLTGIRREDFQQLLALDLIAPAAGGVKLGGGAAPAPAPAAPIAAAAAAASTSVAPTVPASLDARATVPAPIETELDYSTFVSTLVKLISSNLGLRGFTLTLAVEKAGTIEELRAVAERVLDQIADRKGRDAAESARRQLYGG